MSWYHGLLRRRRTSQSVGSVSESSGELWQARDGVWRRGPSRKSGHGGRRSGGLVGSVLVWMRYGCLWTATVKGSNVWGAPKREGGHSGWRVTYPYE